MEWHFHRGMVTFTVVGHHPDHMKTTAWLLPLSVLVFAASSVFTSTSSEHGTLEVLGWAFSVVSGLLTAWSMWDSRRRGRAASSPDQIEQAGRMLRLLTVGFVNDETDRRRAKLATLMPVVWRRLPATGNGRKKAPAAQLAKLLVNDDVRMTVLVGEVGAGKSVACLAAAQTLIAAGPEARIPLMISADSWSPRYTNLADWAADRMRATFTQLRDTVTYGANAVEMLILHGGVLLIIDGFDDIDDDHQLDAFRLLEACPPEISVVLTVREGSHKLPVKLAVRAAERGVGGRALELLRPSFDEVRGHLKSHNPAWRDPRFVTDNGSAAQALRAVLSTQLGAALGLRAYPAGHDPCELLESTRFIDKQDITAHLWQRYLTTTFEDGASHRRTSASKTRTAAKLPSNAISVEWPSGQAVEWLRHLAGHMAPASTELRWQTYHRSITGAWFAPFVMLSTILTTGAFIVLVKVNALHLPGYGLLHLMMALGMVGLATSAVFAIAQKRKFGYEPFADSSSGISYVAGVSAGLWAAPDVSGLGRFLFGIQIGTAALTTLHVGYRLGRLVRPRYLPPERLFRIAGRHALANTVTIAIFYWPTLYGLHLLTGQTDGDVIVMSATYAAFVTTSLVNTHWGSCVSACLMSWCRGQLPLRLLRFLDDTSRLGILHRVGSAYHFKHASLHEHLREA